MAVLLSAAKKIPHIEMICTLLSRQILVWMQVQDDIFQDAWTYMLIVLLGTEATVFYNMISNMLRALGDSRMPLYFLVLSSILNVILDLVFILLLHMGVSGAAWATVLSQLLSAILCLIVGRKAYPVLRLKRDDFHDLKSAALSHLKIGFPMGFQMSVMRTLWIAGIFLNFRLTSLISNIFENILEKLSKIPPIKSFSFV